MADNRTFIEKAQDMVENVKEKITGTHEKECHTQECNQRAEELYGSREGRIHDVTCGQGCTMRETTDCFKEQGKFPQPGVLRDHLESPDCDQFHNVNGGQFRATEDGHEGQIYEKMS